MKTSLPRSSGTHSGLRKLQELLFGLLLFLSLALLPENAMAWIGFDAETTDLMEVQTESFPIVGQILTVTNISTNENSDCLVLSVQINNASIELQLSTSKGKKLLLVMPPF